MEEHPHSDPSGERLPPTHDAAAWRREPPISATREHELRECLRTIPNIPRRQFPFALMRLRRADVEWLLATLPPGEPLDLRGASLRGEDLSGLDLRRLRGGLSASEEVTASDEELAAAAIDLEYAILRETYLQGAVLCGARLDHAVLARARLTGADLVAAHLKEANLRGTHFEGARLRGADLTAVDLREGRLDGADLQDANLVGADLGEAYLRSASLRAADLTNADLNEALLHGADLRDARLEGTNLSFASLGSHDFTSELDAMERETMETLKTWWPDFPPRAKPADLRGAVMNAHTRLNNVLLAEGPIGAAVADVRWGEVNLAVINWKPVKRLQDEYEAREPRTTDDTFDDLPKRKSHRLAEYQAAVRAYFQLATVLQAQGLNEEAVRFAYRGKHLEREVLRRQIFLHARLRRGSARRAAARRRAAVQRRRTLPHIGAARSYFFSVFLDWLAGYGYHPWRTLVWYVICIGAFALAYFHVQPSAGPHFSRGAALVFSLTSFHGRGFFPGELSLNDPITRLAACEAVVGLLIEISFIATFTQRFFGKGADA